MSNGASIVIEGDCAGCGTPVRYEVVPPTPLLRRMTEAAIAGGAPIECDDCIDEADSKRDDGERATRATEARRRRAGMPVELAGMKFGHIEHDDERLPAIEAAEAWGGEHRGVFLYGDVGHGKTRIAAAAANVMLARRRLRWVNVADLLLDLRRPFGDPRYVRALKVLEPVDDPPALVLDDLDKTRAREQDSQPLYVAINAYVEAGAPLFVTANRDLDGVVDQLGDTFGRPIASRLAGYCIDVEVGGRDRRVDP